MKNGLKLTLCILVPLLVGSLGAIATSSSINTWYLSLNKPSFNPPNYLFGPVWTCLYVLMGISFFIILNSKNEIPKKRAIIIFTIQLFLNFIWSFIFFYFQLLSLAFIEIFLLWLFILGMIAEFYKISKVAALLNTPYLLWVSFASVLNGTIWYLN